MKSIYSFYLYILLLIFDDYFFSKILAKRSIEKERTGIV
jgi:hypothetical protein